VPLVAVPSTYPSTTEDELAAHGVNIAIYANQLTRALFPAMESAARSILLHKRALEAEKGCMPIGDIIKLIPEV
jgi:phosphoenolpyruvate phosphomutase